MYLKLPYQIITNFLSTVDQVNAGYRMVDGFLRGNEISATRKVVREILQDRDPDGNTLRRAEMIHRRVYSVPFVNSLWHIDGQHKLVNWKFVIHGGVDGKSRLIVFMLASDNNKASTVENLFLQATQRWGWPQRVRADYGGENLGVRNVMNHVRGSFTLSCRYFTVLTVTFSQ
jgi:hypothetical protein